jgi:hypothetical protein
MFKGFNVIKRERVRVFSYIKFCLLAVFLVVFSSSCHDELKSGEADTKVTKGEVDGGADSSDSVLGDGGWDVSKLDMISSGKMSKSEVKKIIGTPTIEGIDVFIYEYWDPVEAPLKNGVYGFNIHFEDDKAVEVSWSEKS